MSRLLKFGMLYISFIVCLLLTACSHRGFMSSSDRSTNSSTSASSMSHEAMISAAESINTSLLQLEKVERYRKPRIINAKDENMSKYNLGHKVLVDWSGPIEPLISEVAAYSDYKLKVVGVAPAIPILVDIARDSVPIGDVIRQAHLQAKDRASLVIYTKSKTIELRYNEIG